MQRWEVKRLYVPLTIDTWQSDENAPVWHMPKHDDKSEEEYLVAKQLAAEGWELVSVLPAITGVKYGLWGPPGGGGWGMSVMMGYWMFFKRPLSA